MILIRDIYKYQAADDIRTLHNNGEIKLMIAIIKAAIKDLKKLVKKPKHTTLWHAEVITTIKWFTTTSNRDMSLNYICNLLDIDPEGIQLNVMPDILKLKELQKGMLSETDN